MASTTVRIREETKEVLRGLCSQMNRKMGDLLDDAVELFRRRVFLDEANAAFARLRADAKAWREETEERAAWDATLSDDVGD